MLQGFADLRHLKIEVVPVQDPVASLLEGKGDMIAGACGHRGPPPRGA
ncbi:MAG: hypothetical protein HC861_04385, partial [Rhodospirillaceae bacterium]|nr:hypothetical protein [Rhodospirillaceae bacterium]